MCLKHSWKHYGKKYRIIDTSFLSQIRLKPQYKDQYQFRTCIKCRKTEELHKWKYYRLLFHNFLDINRKIKSFNKKKTVLATLLFITILSVPITWRVIIGQPLYFSLNIFILIFFSSGALLFYIQYLFIGNNSELWKRMGVTK